MKIAPIEILALRNGLAWKISENGKHVGIEQTRSKPKVGNSRCAKRTLVWKVRGNWCVGWKSIWQSLIGRDILWRYRRYVSEQRYYLPMGLRWWITSIKPGADLQKAFSLFLELTGIGYGQIERGRQAFEQLVNGQKTFPAVGIGMNDYILCSMHRTLNKEMPFILKGVAAFPLSWKEQFYGLPNPPWAVCPEVRWEEIK
ncbi:MAG: hypothetical protein UT24_C0022G0020 [Candidatus Woesebacteria bacterium GW2011_GWB1_39_12]|uniref:Uncharacterized protein n=1 Tax=Candidatus Woesebacteria bacterium GW2011_GWB1_39_12 TaxID=1618574 RepID=A0A0G0PP22_9BACT|nr:MAG: hypothetical protein UT24_C0022G0020 [Candidatus Woesebacteria bacterium GW2011_GWB1_39_12]